MPKRIVDGEGVWLSKKILSLPQEYRLHYANLLPLAEANGSFEYDAALVKARVYPFLFPDITLEFIEDMFKEMERIGLIHFYDEDGKTWAYFNGIEKPGRLPDWGGRPRIYESNADKQKAYRERKESVTKPVTFVTNLGTITNTIPIPNLNQYNTGNWKILKEHYRRKYRVSPAKRGKSGDYQEVYDKFCIEFGEDRVLQLFDGWADNNPVNDEKFKTYQLTNFFRALPDLIEDEDFNKEQPEEKEEFVMPDYTEVEKQREKEREEKLAQIQADKEFAERTKDQI